MLQQDILCFCGYSENKISKYFMMYTFLLWPPYGIGQAIIFLPYAFFFYLLFSSPNLSSRRVDVYHTSTHGVALVRL